MALTPEQKETRPLTPLDYRRLLSEDDYWQKEDKNGKVVTPPILSHAAVQKLARAFGVTVEVLEWLDREPTKALVTVTAKAHGYAPVTAPYVRILFGLADDADADLDPDWPVPAEGVVQIGECNSGNAGYVGKSFPQCIAEKRAFDRAVLDHLGLFACNGDTEAPAFAKNADYEEASRPAPVEKAAPTVTGEQWGAMPDEVRRLARALAPKHGRDSVDGCYLMGDGKAEDVLAELNALGGADD